MCNCAAEYVSFTQRGADAGQKCHNVLLSAGHKNMMIYEALLRHYIPLLSVTIWIIHVLHFTSQKHNGVMCRGSFGGVSSSWVWWDVWEQSFWGSGGFKILSFQSRLSNYFFLPSGGSCLARWWRNTLANISKDVLLSNMESRIKQYIPSNKHMVLFTIK